MSDLQTLLDRNQQFAADYQGQLQIMPRFSTMVLTCTDARIDPAHFLGLDLGDALVFRNAGGRITDELELELGVLWSMAQKMAGDRFRGFELAIIHHTDCGFERLANPQMAQMLSSRLGVEKAVIADLAIRDHSAHIHADIARLQQSSLVPNQLVVSGHIYDLADGLVHEIAAPTTLHNANELALGAAV